MHIVAIVQARLGSSRLPGKVIADLNGIPLLGHVLQRAKRISGVHQVVLATTSNIIDKQLLEIGERFEVYGFAGSENDVLDRVYQAAVQYRADVIIRMTADCPLIDPGVSSLVLDRFLLGDVDYVSNTNPPTYPDGLDTEVFSFQALAKTWREASLQSEREHVTPYIWKNPDQFRLANITGSHDYSHLRWVVDEPADLEAVRYIYSQLGKSTSAFSWLEVLKLYDADSELLSINKNIARNEGYVQSLKNDEVGKEE